MASRTSPTPKKTRSGNKLPVPAPAAVGGPLRVRGPAELGRFIRTYRKERGITLVEAAGLAGVGTRFLLELEHGKTTASLGKTLQVLERMGIWVEIGTRSSRP